MVRQEAYFADRFGGHPQMVRLRDVFALAAKPYLVYDRWGSDLRQFLTSVDFPTPPQLRAVVADIASALTHLHWHHLIHGDLKTANLLTTTEHNQWKTKLCDVGTMVEVGVACAFRAP